ncbi:MAG: chitobiase/beta-hexosaminidase C-terminal domain-containing protein [Lachnospiraceae bacterium]
MNCKSCGATIEDGMLYCESCGEEVQIVPDYNPLDEVIAAQVKGAINGGTFTIPETMLDRTERQETYQQTDPRRKIKSAENRSKGKHVSKSPMEMGREEERRKKQNVRKKQLRLRKRKIRLLTISAAILMFGIICVFLYSTSFGGQLKKGYKKLDQKQYEASEQYFKKAISKKKERPEGYTGLAKVYVAMDEFEKAESLFLDTIEKDPSNSEIYKAAINFYMDTKQPEKISVLLSDCEDSSVIKNLKDYKSNPPGFSLKEDVYDDVQQLSLTTKGKAIYYTIDDSEPTTLSTKYSEPIQLGEGTTIIRAISVSKRGIPSLETKKEYTVELPSEDPPAVAPSTGQYEQNMKIEVQVPAGCEAYYTTDGSVPTAASKKYIGPIDMPTGNTLFSAILINGKGKTSEVTKRNYDLTMNE